jgi:hypothetical protein
MDTPDIAVSPALELEQIRRDRISGAISDADWRNGKAARFEQLAAAGSPTETPATIPDEQRLALMTDMRQRRIDGKCSDAEWAGFAELAEGRMPPQPMPQTLEQQLVGDVSQPDPNAYTFAHHPHFNPTPESMALDAQMRGAFSAAAVPVSFGNAIYEAADRTMQQLEHASPEARQARLGEVRAQLQRVWGTDYDARLDAIDELVAVITAHSDELAEYVDSYPWMFADIGVMNWLDQVAQQRRRARTSTGG